MELNGYTNLKLKVHKYVTLHKTLAVFSSHWGYFVAFSYYFKVGTFSQMFLGYFYSSQMKLSIYFKGPESKTD